MKNIPLPPMPGLHLTKWCRHNAPTFGPQALHIMNLAILKQDSPFYPLFPHGVAIINVLIPDRAICEGDNHNQPQDTYKVDLKKLTPEKFNEVISMVAQRQGGTPAEIKASFEALGFIPMRAIHVSSVATDTRAFL